MSAMATISIRNLDENLSQKDDYEELDNLNLSYNINNIKDLNPANNFNDLDLSMFGCFLRVIKISLFMLMTMLISTFRFVLIYFFTKHENINFLQSLTITAPLYICCSFGICYSTSQYFGFKTAMYSSKKEYLNIGLLLNKAIVYNLSVAFFLTILFLFILNPILQLLNFDDEVIYYNSILFKFFGLSLPFQFFQFLILKYFYCIRVVGHISIGQLLGFCVQIIFQCIIILGFKNSAIGTGLSFLLGTSSTFIYNYILYKLINPYKKADIKFNFAETFDDFYDYFKNSISTGFVCFLQIISFEILPVLSFIFGPVGFATYGIITNSVTALQLLAEAITTANNIEVNSAIGMNKPSYIRTSFITCFILNGIYSLIMAVVFLFFTRNIYSLYTNNVEVLNILNDLKYLIIIIVITQNFFTIITEGLSCLGENTLVIVSLILFRYLSVFGFTLIFWNYTPLKYYSLCLSLAIGNIIIIITNGGYLLFKLSNLEKENIFKKKN